MAERSSARASGRRKTPQPIAQSHSPPRRNTRITRSQSREIDFQKIARKPKIIDGEDSTESGRNAKNDAVYPSRPSQGLPKIDETLNNSYPQLSQNDVVADEAVVRGADTPRRQSGQTVRSTGTGRISAFSGTTVRNSQSGQKLSSASADDPDHADWDRPLTAMAIRPAVARLKQRADSRRASRDQQPLVQNPRLPVSPLSGSSSTKVIAMPTEKLPVSAVPASAPTKVANKILSPSRRSSQWQPPPLNEDESLFLDEDETPSGDDVPSPRRVEKIVQTAEKDNAESSKENPATKPGVQGSLASQSIPPREAPTRKGKYIDAQPGAERIAWESQDPRSPPPSSSRQLAVEHTRDQDSESQIESSEGEGFQQDNRRVTRTKKRNAAPRADGFNPHGGSPAKKARHVRERPALAEVDMLGSTTERHDNVNEPPRPSQIEVYREVNSSAKHRVASQPKGPQRRKPWLEAETSRLQELVEEYGISWALLKERDQNHARGQELKDRDQVALKDKARNMKMDYLK
ncbi:MAG: hypothetical protein Q9223_000811 [Gallowayella weberi]